MNESPVTLFIPFGEGYGKPGLTLRAETTKELDAEIRLLTDSTDEQPALLDSLLSGVETIRAAILLKFPQEEKKIQTRSSNNVPPPAQSGSNIPTCGNDGSHGPMKYKEGTNARGNWKGYFCTLPYGSGSQCKPVFIK